MAKSRNNKRNRRNRKRRVNNRLGFQELPEINNKPIQTRCIRYNGTMNSPPSTFNSRDLLNFIGFVTSASTTYYPLVDSVKLLRVGVTVLPNDLSSAGTVSFTWLGLNAPEIRETMLVANAIPAHRSFYPPEGASAWFWWDNSSTTTNLFSVRNSQGTDLAIILDLELQYILNTGALTSVALTGASSLTGIAYRYLPITGLNFMPVDLDTVQ